MRAWSHVLQWTVPTWSQGNRRAHVPGKSLPFHLWGPQARGGLGGYTSTESPLGQLSAPTPLHYLFLNTWRAQRAWSQAHVRHPDPLGSGS